MKSLILSALVFFSSIVLAQVQFQYRTGEEVSFSVEEVAAVTLKSKIQSQNGFVAPELTGLPELLLQKLLFANSRDVLLVNNDEYPELLKLMGLSHDEVVVLRHQFIHEVALQIIRDMKQNPNLQLRILARDLNEVYEEVITILKTRVLTNFQVSEQERIQILSRIRLVPASRPMIDSIIKSPNAESEIMALFGINKADVNKKYLLLDSGYEGSIVNKLAAYFRPMLQQQQIEWAFIWRAPHAPQVVKTFEVPDFKANLQQRGLWEKFNQGDLRQSFRVVAFEHFPKWTGRALSWKADPVYIMLDLDDTLLKEVDIQKYRNHPQVQFVEYVPSASVAAKYRDRLKNGADKNKLIHFELRGETLIGALTLRPSLASVIASFEGLIKSGRLRLLITSNNDPQRTEAIFSQVRLNGRTLKELGATLVNNRFFNTPDFKKDMGMLRRNLGIPTSSTVMALDDLPGNYVRSSILDVVEAVVPFDSEYANKTLEKQASALEFLDLRQYLGFYDSVLKASIVTEDQTAQNKLRSVYLRLGQAHYRAKKEIIPACKILFGSPL